MYESYFVWRTSWCIHNIMILIIINICIHGWHTYRMSLCRHRRWHRRRQMATAQPLVSISGPNLLPYGAHEYSNPFSSAWLAWRAAFPWTFLPTYWYTCLLSGSGSYVLLPESLEWPHRRQTRDPTWTPHIYIYMYIEASMFRSHDDIGCIVRTVQSSTRLMSLWLLSCKFPSS